MNRRLIFAILSNSFLSAVVVGSRVSIQTSLENDRSHFAGALLNAECQPSIPEEPCVTGSALKRMPLGTEFCECLQGKKMALRTNSTARSLASCTAQRTGGSSFWVSEASSNVDCTCPGYGRRTCEPEVSVQDAEGNFLKSKLKCMHQEEGALQDHHVCKIDLGYFCDPDAGTQPQASESACNYPHAGCGPISHRCVASSARIREVDLNKEASKEHASANVMHAVTALGKASMGADTIPCKKDCSDSTFYEAGWDNRVASACEDAGLTEHCRHYY